MDAQVLESERAGSATGRHRALGWLRALGPVAHRLDYGGNVAVIVGADVRGPIGLVDALPLADVVVLVAGDDRRVELGAELGDRTCEVVVGSPEALEPGAYDVVCLVGSLRHEPARHRLACAALRATRADGAVLIVESGAIDDLDGPIQIGAAVLDAGAEQVRIAAVEAHGFVLAARPVPTTPATARRGR